MKKLFASLALVLGLVSCQNDIELGVNVGGEQDAVINVALSDETRADSAFGSLENGVLKDYQLRYILEIYLGDKCSRQVVYSDQSTASFPVRLAPGRAYDFVVWADFVEKSYTDVNADADLFYETSEGLDKISIKNGAPMTEARDAFYGVYNLAADKQVASIGTINLYRPFAKLRVVTTDIDDLQKIHVAAPTTATVTYASDVTIYNKFNARTKAVASESAVKEYAINYNGTYTDAEGEMTLLSDYLLVPTTGSTVKFTLNVAEHVNKTFGTDIPLNANKLTSIKGDILTSGSDINVDINGGLEENKFTATNLEQFKAALAIPGATVTLANDLEISEKLEIKNDVTIDGNDKTITYKGSDRVIDIPFGETTRAAAGTNVTISNLTVAFGSSYCQRGINFNNAGKLVLNNVKVLEGATYALNLPGSSDNCEVELNNCELTGNIALNVWGENSRINATDTIFQNVDKTTTECYATISLNNDGAATADGSIVNIVGGKVLAEGDSFAASNATINGQIIFSETTERVGEIDVVKVAIIYTNTTDFYTHNTLQAAINKASETPATASVRLLQDIEVSDVVWVKKGITIDLNGKTVSTTADRLFRVDNEGAEVINVTIKNGEILNEVSGGRCVETRSGKLNLTLDNVELTALNGAYTQPFTVGGSGSDITVNIKNSTITAGHYAVTTFNPVALTIENSTINGYAALYFKAASGSLGSVGSVVNVKGSTLVGASTAVYDESNSFATVVFEDSDIELYIDANSTVKATTVANNQDLFGIKSPADKNLVKVATGATLETATNGGIAGLYDVNENILKFPAAYADALVTEGYTVSSVDAEGLVTIEGMGTKATTAEELAEALANGGNIVLGADVTLTEAVIIAADNVAVLDLDGKTLTAGDSGYAIKNLGTLTIKGNGTINGIVYAEGAEANTTVENGTFNANGGAYVFLNSQGGTLTINGGVINGGSSYPVYSYDAGSKLVINDATVNGTFGCVNAYGTTGSVEINGGTYQMTGVQGNTSHIAYFSNVDATINGGTFKKIGDISMSGAGGGGICAIYGANLTIKGGKFVGDYVDVYDWGGTNKNGRAVAISINGGEFKFKPSFIAEGYKAVENGNGTWSVVAE